MNRRRLTLIAAGVAVVAISLCVNSLRSGENGRTPASRKSETAASGGTASPAKGATLQDALKLARVSQAVLANIRDYKANFDKSELVNGKLIEQSMEMKLRHDPFSVYMRFRSGKEAGREALFVANQNDGKLLVRESGFLKSLAGILRYAPDDPMVMEENRYPITDVGLAKIIEKSIAAWEEDARSDPSKVEVRIDREARVGATVCTLIQVMRNEQRRDLVYHISRVFIDPKTKLPVQAEQYGWPSQPGQEPPLLERYVYTDVEINVGLKDSDFEL
jgi:hypothetical protein